MAVFSKNQKRTERETNNNIDNVEYQTQVNLNDRLDYMRFKNYTKAEFDSTAPHDTTDISFVTNTDNSISLYKGDTLLSGEGSGFIFRNAVRVGAGTGIGGEPSGNKEIANIFGYNNARDNTNNNSSMGRLSNQLIYYRATNSTSSGSYWRAGRTMRLNALGRLWFRPAVSNDKRWFPIICNKRKAMVRPGIRSVADYTDIGSGTSSGTPGLSALSFSPTGKIYLWRNGQRESIEYSLEVTNITFAWSGRYLNNQEVRESRGILNSTYKVKITHTGNGFSKTRFLTRELEPTYTRRVLGVDEYILTSGVVFGFDRVEKSDAHELYGQLKDPCILFYSPQRGLRHIKESANEPYGLFYDISTGAALSEPFVEFANTKERDLAYICGLEESVIL